MIFMEKLANDCWGCELNERNKRGEIERVVYDSELVLAHYVPNSWAEIHIRIQSKEHIPTALDINPSHEAIVLDMMTALRRATAEILQTKEGVRIYMNIGGFQGTKHIHFHVTYHSLAVSTEKDERKQARNQEDIVYDGQHMLAYYTPNVEPEIHIRIQPKGPVSCFLDLIDSGRDHILLDLMNAIQAAAGEIMKTKRGCRLYISVGDFQTSEQFYCHVAFTEKDEDE